MRINYKKSLQTCILLLIFVFIVIVCFSSISSNFINKKQDVGLERTLSEYAINNQNDFSFEIMNTNKKISQIKAKSGFDYEYLITDYSPAAYEVELVTPKGNIFIEGSYSNNSIFNDTNYEQYYYGGINQYYAEVEGIWINMLTNTKLDEMPTAIMSFNFDNSKINKEDEKESNIMKMSSTVSGFKVINNYEYFKNLTNFPNHVNINKVYPGTVGTNINPGTCGVVAVSMLLGYYQNYTNWNIIPQSAYRNGNGTNDAFAEYLFKSWIWDGKSIGAEGTIMGAYDIVSKDNAGFPMASVENKTLIQKFAKSNNQTYKHNASSWFPKTNVEKYIDKDVPSIGTTTSYKMSESSEKSKSFHNVIIYGYANDKYLCHMGWNPGTSKYAEIILSELALHSYYTISK